MIGGDVVLSCENVHKTYLMGVEGVAALRGVSLDIRRGEFVVIYGTSGGGKTTLLNILGTIDTATKGNVVVLGKRVAQGTGDADLARLRLESIGFVFQSFNLLSTMSASENVEMPMILVGRYDADERRRRVHELLTMVGLGHRLEHLPSQLSGGEQQRATIARALANDPSLLLMDEPTGDLDTKNTVIVLDLLLRLNEEKGITIVMVTHDPHMKHLAHRAVYLRDGKLHKIDRTDVKEREAATAAVCAQLNRGCAIDVHHVAQTIYRTREHYTEVYEALRSTDDLPSTNPFINAHVLSLLFGALEQHGTDGIRKVSPFTGDIEMVDTSPRGYFSRTFLGAGTSVSTPLL